jgi:hypothetical protein
VGLQANQPRPNTLTTAALMKSARQFKRPAKHQDPGNFTS